MSILQLPRSLFQRACIGAFARCLLHCQALRSATSLRFSELDPDSLLSARQILKKSEEEGLCLARVLQAAGDPAIVFRASHFDIVRHEKPASKLFGGAYSS